MLERPVFHDRQVRGDSDAVIRTQRRPVRHQDVPFADDLDGILLEIVLDVLVLLADHVEVPLQADHRNALAARRGGLSDDDVQVLVLLGLETEPLGSLQNIVRYLLLVLRSSRDLADLREIPPHGLRLQSCDRA